MTDATVSRFQSPEPPLLAGLIRGELLGSMKELQRAFVTLDEMSRAGLIPTTLSGKAVFDDASAMLAALTEKMELLAGLSETYSAQQSSNQERFFVYALLREVIGARKEGVTGRFTAREPHTDVAPVYGNKHWLQLLLKYLVRQLDATVSPDERIVFTIRQLGNHMVLASSTEGLSAAERRHPRVPRQIDVGLSASFCERIAELHGGSLRFSCEEDGNVDTLVGVTLSLPTSIGAQATGIRCGECPMLEQIERYASDLALLMDRCERLESGKGGHA